MFQIAPLVTDDFDVPVPVPQQMDGDALGSFLARTGFHVGIWHKCVKRCKYLPQVRGKPIHLRVFFTASRSLVDYSNMKSETCRKMLQVSENVQEYAASEPDTSLPTCQASQPGPMQLEAMGPEAIRPDLTRCSVM